MKDFGGYLVLGIVAIVVLLVLLGATSPGQNELRAEQAQIEMEHARVLAPLNLAVGRVARVSAILVLGALSCVAAAAGIISVASIPHGIRAARLRSWLVKPTRSALYPALAAPDGTGHITIINPVNETAAQRVAALVNGNVDRLNGSAARQALNPKDPEAMLPEPPALPAEFAPADVIQPDPQNRPDTLIVGQKGSGKTNTLRWIIDAYRQAMPDAEFMILSPIGSNWGLPGTITQPEDIRRAVLRLRAEMDTRDRLMQAAGVRDYHRWTDAPRRVVVVVDEAEAVADMIKLQSTAQAREFSGTLRVVVNMGRNFGYLIVQGTQTARADVMDPAFMHNAATLLMMRMDAATAARFNQYDREIVAGLPTLARGRAYCPQAGGYVQFPLVKEIRPPRLSTIYTPTLQLPADAEADGLGAEDQPDSEGVVLVNPGSGAGTMELELEPQEEWLYAAETPVLRRVPTVPVPPQKIETRRRPTPIEAAAMRAWYHRRKSKTAVCLLFYGYKNDDVWAWVEEALAGRI